MASRQEAQDDTLFPEFGTYPHFIQVTQQENGLLHVKTNTHNCKDIRESELQYITMPYCGVTTSLEIQVEDEELRAKVINAFNHATDLHIFLHDEHPVLRNHFKNLSLNPYSISSIRGKCRDRPILFLGAGPSLKDNLAFVKEAIWSNSHVVIAGGSANRVLSEAKIYPHLAFAFDPHPTEWDFVFSRLSTEYIKKVPLVSTTGLDHKCARAYSGVGGRVFMAPSQSFPTLMKYLYPEEHFIPEGRVGVSTMLPYLAVYMGCKDVRYLGVDLCYAEGGKLYSDDKSLDVKQSWKAEQDGLKTKLLWQREAEDIVKNCKELKVVISTYSDVTLLKSYGVAAVPVWAAEPRKRVKLRGKKWATDQASRKRLGDVLVQATDFYNVKSASDEHIDKESEFFKHYLKNYYLVQEFREIRTGDMNMPLLRAVSKQLIDEIEGVL